MSDILKDQILARVEERLRALGVTANAAGTQSGLGKDLIRDWRRSKGLPRLDSLQRLATVLRTTPQWLAYGVGEAQVANLSVPVVSWVAASQFADAEQVVDTSDLPRLSVGEIGDGRFIALRVRGDSMNEVAPDDSYIVVSLDQTDLIARRFYVFLRDGEATFKRYMVDPVRLEPFSTNKAHEALPVTEGTTPLGRVVRVIYDL